MIIRTNLKWNVILAYTWRRIVYAILVALLASALFVLWGQKWAGLSFSAVGGLGSALAIFLAFRNNSSYDRWWEARKLWGRLLNASRVFARQITTFIKGAPEETRALHRELVYRHIAYCNALRFHLRKQKELLDELGPFLLPGELEAYRASSNPPNAIAQRQGERLRDLYDSGLLNDFRYMRLDRLLTELLDIQGGCERIKNTPLPRQYDFYPRLFVYLYTFFLPFGLVKELGWLTLLVSVPTSFVFFVLEGIGRNNENPFENRIQDTPMSALCRTIEINLREQLGEKELPPPLAPVDGYVL